MAGDENDLRPGPPAKPGPAQRPPAGQGAATPDGGLVPAPSLPAETFGQGSPLDHIGSVPPGEAESSAGSID